MGLGGGGGVESTESRPKGSTPLSKYTLLLLEPDPVSNDTKLPFFVGFAGAETAVSLGPNLWTTFFFTPLLDGRLRKDAIFPFCLFTALKEHVCLV